MCLQATATVSHDFDASHCARPQSLPLSSWPSLWASQVWPPQSPPSLSSPTRSRSQWPRPVPPPSPWQSGRSAPSALPRSSRSPAPWGSRSRGSPWAARPAHTSHVTPCSPPRSINAWICRQSGLRVRPLLPSAPQTPDEAFPQWQSRWLQVPSSGHHRHALGPYGHCRGKSRSPRFCLLESALS